MDPVARFSPCNAQSISSCLDRLEPSREFVAMAAATELAELPPIPPDRGRPFQISISKPAVVALARSNTALAATPATLFSGSVGIPESLLWIHLIVIPGLGLRVTSTMSPKLLSELSKASPRISNPQMTFPTVAPAEARALVGCFISRSL